MAHDRIISWLKGWRKKEYAQNLVGSFLALAGGCLALVATFWLVYCGIVMATVGISALSDLISGKKVDLSHEWRMALSFGFLVLLFVHTLRTRGAPPEPVDDEFAQPHSVPMMTGWLGAEFFVIQHPLATAGWLTYVLCFGPMCVLGCGRLFMRAQRVKKLQLEDLAPVLGFMLAKASSVTQEELESEFLELPWPQTTRDLLLIDGVVLLKADGSRLTMTVELRKEICGIAETD